MAKKLPADCMPKCSTCRFQQDDKCHRSPPVFVSDEDGSGFVFPDVDAEDWCAEYIRRTNS
jgi:hypothetical protein